MTTVSTNVAPDGAVKKRKYSDLMKGALLTVLGAGFGVLAAHLTFGSVPESSVKEDTWLVIGSVLPLFVLVIVLHELGHLAGGWISGFRFVLFIVGPLSVVREGERIRFRLNRSWAMAGGLAGSLPKTVIPPADLRRKMIVSVAGGPLVSLLSTAAGLAAGWAVHPWNPTLSSVCFFFGILSGAIAFATSIPMALGGFWSDGARLLQLFRGGYEAERWCSIAVLGGMGLVKQRPRDWPSPLVAAASEHSDQSFDDITGAILRYSWHYDRDEREEAGRWLDYALEHAGNWPASMRGTIYAEAAFYNAFERNEALKAREFLKQVSSNPLIPKYTLKLSEGAVLLAEGDLPGAREAAHAALADLNSDAQPCPAQRETIDELLRRAGGA